MATWWLPPQDNGLKCVMGCHLKAHYKKVIMWGGGKPSTLPHVRLHHVMSPAGEHRCCCLVPVQIVSTLFAQIHYLGNGKRRKLLIKDVPTLWLLQAVCRHLEPAVSSPLKERKRERGGGGQGTYWSADRGTALHDNSPTPPQRGKRGGRGGEKRGWEKTTHEDTFEDIFTHSLYTRSQHLMSRSYWRLRGLCWVFVIFFFSLPVEERWDTSCQLKGKGGVSFAHLPEVWSPTQND